jgi:hypothetical protein
MTLDSPSHLECPNQMVGHRWAAILLVTAPLRYRPAAIFLIATLAFDASLNAIDGLALLHHETTATWMIR